MSSNRSWFDRWIFESYTVTPEGLALYRIAFALFALLFVAPGHSQYASFTSFATLPDAFFLPPPGPMQFVSGFPPVAFFEALHVLLPLSLAALLFGVYTRAASVTTTVLFLLGYGFSYSVGKVNHNMLFVLLPAVMALSNWGAAYSVDAQRGRTSRVVASWPIVLVVLITGFAMFTAGVPKILGGWLDPSTQAAQGRLVRQVFVHGRTDLLAPFAAQFDNPVVWELADIATVVFEVGFLVAVLHPFTTRLFAVGAVAFHTGIMAVMNIAFLYNFIVYAAVLPWARIARALPIWRSGSLFTGRFGGLLGGAFVVGTAAFFYVVGSPLLWLNETVGFVSDLTVVDVTGIAIAWLVLIALLVFRGVSRAKTGTPHSESFRPSRERVGT